MVVEKLSSRAELPPGLAPAVHGGPEYPEYNGVGSSLKCVGDERALSHDGDLAGTITLRPAGVPARRATRWVFRRSRAMSLG